jgi:RNA polymerase sigma-70 factor (ECF subfamily)
MDSDPNWIGMLLDRHASALELYARQWCGDPDVQDVVQEAFLNLARQKFRPDQPAAWLFRVVRNGAIKAALSARRRRRHEAEAAALGSWFKTDGAGERIDSIDPESAAEALRALPLEQREVIVARLWGGLTFEQVAEVVGCSSSTAHRLYQSGLEALRGRLGVACPTNSRPNRCPNPN